MCAAVDEKGQTIEIPVTDIVLAAGPWTARLASKLLGKRAGAALDIEPRFVTPFSAPRSLLTARMVLPIAGAQPLLYFDPQSPSPCMPSSPNSLCLPANRTLLNSTPAQMARYVCVEATLAPFTSDTSGGRHALGARGEESDGRPQVARWARFR